jgi:phage shock protein A
MFDEEEKPKSFENEGAGPEEKPKTLEQEIADLKDELLFLTRRVVALEEDMRSAKEQLNKMSFSPGL